MGSFRVVGSHLRLGGEARSRTELVRVALEVSGVIGFLDGASIRMSITSEFKGVEGAYSRVRLDGEGLLLVLVLMLVARDGVLDFVDDSGHDEWVGLWVERVEMGVVDKIDLGEVRALYTLIRLPLDDAL